MLSEKEIAEITERLNTLEKAFLDRLYNDYTTSDLDLKETINGCFALLADNAEKDKIIEGLEDTIREIYKLTQTNDTYSTGWGIVTAIKQWCLPVMFLINQPKTGESNG